MCYDLLNERTNEFRWLAKANNHDLKICHQLHKQLLPLVSNPQHSYRGCGSFIHCVASENNL